MADTTTGAEGGGSILNNPLFYLGCGLLLVGGGVFAWKKYGQPEIVEDTKTETSTTTVPSKSDAKQASAPSGAPAKSDGKDYTDLPNGKSVFATSPDEKNGLKLGSDVTIKSGATVTRMDKGLAEMGTTKLTSNTALGTVWHLYPSSIIVKAKSGFSYPFYKVAVSEVDKGIGAVIGNLMSGFTNANIAAEGQRYMGADGFGGFEHLPAETRKTEREAKVTSVIDKITNQYMGKFGVHGIGSNNLFLSDGGHILLGIKIESTNAAQAEANMPEEIDGYRLFFEQGNMAQAQKQLNDSGYLNATGSDKMSLLAKKIYQSQAPSFSNFFSSDRTTPLKVIKGLKSQANWDKLQARFTEMYGSEIPAYLAEFIDTDEIDRAINGLT